MPSYTEEQRCKAIEAAEECGGSVARAIRKLGYPSRHTLYEWLNRHGASRERGAVGRGATAIPPSRHEPEHGARRQQPGGGVRDPLGGPGPRGPLGPRPPLLLARLDSHMREERAGQVNVVEGPRPGQLRDGGFLQVAQKRVLPSQRLVGGVGTGVLPHARRLPEVLQRGAAEGEAGLDEPDAAP